MKKLIFLAGCFCLQMNLYAIPSGEPVKKDFGTTSANDRAKAHFRANFKGASEVNWSTTKDKNILCSFHQGDTSSRVYYNKHGYWRYTIMSYPGYQLPKTVKDMVEEYFACYRISFAHEVRSMTTDPVYIINIEDEDNIKVIKISGDQLEVRQDLQKR